MKKLRTERAIVVEGRDDVDAVQRAADALIIPTHGFGISAETWEVLEKAHAEKGLIVLTDPDHAGEQIRKRPEARFPGCVHAFVDRRDASEADDIGIENASPGAIREALEKALRRDIHPERSEAEAKDLTAPVTMADLAELGLAGSEGAAERRAAVSRKLGTGYCNARAMIKRLRGFGIDRDELRKAVEEVKSEEGKQIQRQEAGGTRRSEA